MTQTLAPFNSVCDDCDCGPEDGHFGEGFHFTLCPDYEQHHGLRPEPYQAQWAQKRNRLMLSKLEVLVTRRERAYQRWAATSAGTDAALQAQMAMHALATEVNDLKALIAAQMETER
jgi:hypothetical protein